MLGDGARAGLAGGRFTRSAAARAAGGGGGGALLKRVRNRWVAALAAALLFAGFSLRLLVDEPGPLFLLPIALAGVAGGRRAGLGVGVAAALLFALAANLNATTDDSVLVAFVVHLPVYGLVGYLVGRLAEERRQLGTELVQKETEVAELKAIQDALAPAEIPSRPGLEVAASYLPASDGASGDFYLVAPGPGEDTTVVAVGDVVGKGIEAAQLAAYVRTAIATSAPYVDDPRRLLELANRALIERAGTSSRFVTAACAVYARPTGLLRWSLAGHWPPLWLNGGRALDQDERGQPLGIATELECGIEELSLAPGNGLLLFTDGVPEARRDNGRLELFGPGRLRAAVEGMDGADPRTIVETLSHAVCEFSGEQLADDVCMVALRAS